MREQLITFAIVAMFSVTIIFIPERKVYRVEQTDRMYPVFMNGKEFKQYVNNCDKLKKDYSYNYSIGTRTVEVEVFY